MSSSSATCDLHTHTYYSDGRASPRELLQHAASIGLHTLAITDHDTAAGAREALPAAAELGIELIPAVEFTCFWEELSAPAGQTDIDLLGYYVRLDEPRFQAAERAASDDIQERVADCCERLAEAGYTVTLEHIRQQNPHYSGLLPLVKALKERYKLSPSASGALVDAAWQEVRPCRFGIKEAIGTVHAAGGVAVLAHPSLVAWGNGGLLAGTLEQLVGWGLDGLEVFHPRLDLEERRLFLSFAERFGLVVTGGSDEHGWPAGFPNLGAEAITDNVVTALRTRRSDYRKSK